MASDKKVSTANTEDSVETLDDILEKIGGFGLYQKWIFVLTCYPYLLAGFFELNPVFLLGIPEHRCAIPGYDNDTYEVQGQEHLYLINLTIPRSTVTDREYDRCQMFDYPNNSLSFSFDRLNTTGTRTKVKCNKWVYDRTVFKNTFTSQVDLVCDDEIWVANAGMIFYAGMLFGSLASGLLADRYGRKPVMYVSALVMTAGSIILAWVTTLWQFCLLEFIIGAGVIATFMPGFVISIEITGSSKRVWPGIISNYPYTVGLLILTGIAYGFRDWFYIELCTSIPGVIMISFWWLIPESPRWLLTEGRNQEAEAIIRKAARWNKATLPPGDLFKKKYVDKDKSDVSFVQLFTHKILCIRTVLIFFNWMAVSLAYFGLALNSDNLSGDLYLNFSLSGLVEFPAYLIVTYLVERFGRRIPYCVLMIVGGIACISAIFPITYTPEGSEVITLVLALIGRFCTTAAFSIVYIHSVELFPTVLRNAGMGGAALFARVGTMIAPYIVILGASMGDRMGEALPLIIFGAISLLSGVTSKWLPETLNRDLPETVEDSVEFGRVKDKTVSTTFQHKRDIEEEVSVRL